MKVYHGTTIDNVASLLNHPKVLKENINLATHMVNVLA